MAHLLTPLGRGGRGGSSGHGGVGNGGLWWPEMTLKSDGHVAVDGAILPILT